MSSSSESKKRTVKPEPDYSSDSNPPSPETPSKKIKTTPSSTKNKSPKKSSTKADAWTPELRLRLFEAYESSSQVKWDEVARKVGLVLYRSMWKVADERWEMRRMLKLVGSNGSVLLGRRSRLRSRKRASLELGDEVGVCGSKKGEDHGYHSVKGIWS